MCYESGTKDHHKFHNQLMPIPTDSLPTILKSLIDDLVDSANVLEELYKSIDFDQRDLEDARTEFEEAAGDEKLCVENLLDSIGYVIRFFGDQLASVYQETILPFCQKYMGSPFEYIRFIGACSIDDMMLYAPSTASAFVGDAMNFFTQNMNCEDPALRQVVLFGIKIAIENFCDSIRGNAKMLCTALMQTINREDAYDEEYSSASDNAVSALFSLTRFCRQNLSPKEFHAAIGCVCDHLPLQADCAEAQDVHEHVVEELMKPNHGVFDNANVLNGVMRSLPIMLLPVYDEGDNESEISYDETKAAIVNILKTLDNRSMMSLMNGLDPDVKAAVASVLGA